MHRSLHSVISVLNRIFRVLAERPHTNGLPRRTRCTLLRVLLPEPLDVPPLVVVVAVALLVAVPHLELGAVVQLAVLEVEAGVWRSAIHLETLVSLEERDHSRSAKPYSWNWLSGRRTQRHGLWSFHRSQPQRRASSWHKWP